MQREWLMMQQFTSDFADEDTDVAPEPRPQRRSAPRGPNDTQDVELSREPSYELVWVEEEGYGMVLRVRRITSN